MKINRKYYYAMIIVVFLSLISDVSPKRKFSHQKDKTKIIFNEEDQVYSIEKNEELEHYKPNQSDARHKLKLFIKPGDEITIRLYPLVGKKRRDITVMVLFGSHHFYDSFRIRGHQWKTEEIEDNGKIIKVDRFDFKVKNPEDEDPYYDEEDQDAKNKNGKKDGKIVEIERPKIEKPKILGIGAHNRPPRFRRNNIQKQLESKNSKQDA